MLVDRITLAVPELFATGDAATIDDLQPMLRRARAVLVCPRICRAGFILGGEGSGCALAARDAAGSLVLARLRRARSRSREGVNLF